MRHQNGALANRTVNDTEYSRSALTLPHKYRRYSETISRWMGTPEWQYCSSPADFPEPWSQHSDGTKTGDDSRAATQRVRTPHSSPSPPSRVLCGGRLSGRGSVRLFVERLRVFACQWRQNIAGSRGGGLSFGWENVSGGFLLEEAERSLAANQNMPSFICHLNSANSFI